VNATSGGLHGINITPLVDVSLVLVLIFMVTMPLGMIHGIDVNRQALKKYGLTTPRENVSLHLTARGVFVKEGRGRETGVNDADLAQVLAGLIEASKTKRVLISADRDALHGRTVRAMDMAKQSGASDIALLETE
jgi:biopolymer transport protein ExbD